MTSSASELILSGYSCVITPILWQVLSKHVTKEAAALKSQFEFFGKISVGVLAEERGRRFFFFLKAEMKENAY